MNKLKKWLRSPAATLVGFAVAAGLLLFSTVGGASAAINDATNYFGGQIEMKQIGVSLLENGDRVSYRDFVESSDAYSNGSFVSVSGDLLTDLPAEGISVGKKYPEVLTVKNTGSIGQYVRVTIYKYWRKKGSTDKDTTLSPAMIHVELDNYGSSWILDESSTTPERIVLYYSGRLGDGDETDPFTKSIMLDGSLARKVYQEQDPNDSSRIVTKYAYADLELVLEVQVDAVQDHHASDAMRSAWGVDGADKGVSISE